MRLWAVRSGRASYSGRVLKVAKLAPLLDDAEAQKAVDILRRDFTDPESVGPRRVAEFVTGGPDDDVQADVVGFVGQLLGALDDGTPHEGARVAATRAGPARGAAKGSRARGVP